MNNENAMISHCENRRGRLGLAKDFMDNHFPEQITLKSLSEIALLNPRYFLKVFKSTFYITPHQYLTTIRLSKAKELLKKNYKVSVVCKRVGFEDIASFSKLFKRLVGVSPFEFKKMMTKCNSHTSIVMME